jgi:hypothetical protein
VHGHVEVFSAVGLHDQVIPRTHSHVWIPQKRLLDLEEKWYLRRCWRGHRRGRWSASRSRRGSRHRSPSGGRGGCPGRSRCGRECRRSGWTQNGQNCSSGAVGVLAGGSDSVESGLNIGWHAQLQVGEATVGRGGSGSLNQKHVSPRLLSKVLDAHQFLGCESRPKHSDRRSGPGRAGLQRYNGRYGRWRRRRVGRDGRVSRLTGCRRDERQHGQ